MLRTTIASTGHRTPSLVLKRFQSSSKKDLNVNSLNPVLPKIKSTIPSLTNSSNVSTPKKHISSSRLDNQKAEMKPKKGFSSLPKVASTYQYNPKDLLLDSFFNGYRPMTLPITPPKRQILKPKFPPPLTSAGGAFVYFEIDDNMDFMEDAKNDMDPNVSHTIQDIERQTSTRFDHSHKSLKEDDLKKEEYERELYETKLELAKEEDFVDIDNTSNIVESKRIRGRRRLQYKRKSGKK